MCNSNWNLHKSCLHIVYVNESGTCKIMQNRICIRISNQCTIICWWLLAENLDAMFMCQRTVYISLIHTLCNKFTTIAAMEALRYLIATIRIHHHSLVLFNRSFRRVWIVCCDWRMWSAFLLFFTPDIDVFSFIRATNVQSHNVTNLENNVKRNIEIERIKGCDIWIFLLVIPYIFLYIIPLLL